MDFFARQAEVRRLSRWMVLLFILAIAAIVVAIDAVVIVAAGIMTNQGGIFALEPDSFVNYPGLIAISTFIVLGTIGTASAVRTMSLSAGGGGSVAESLGGTRVTADVTDPLKRRLRNVVEEMAIASGVPVPQVFVLDRESGINAFAAGHNPASAAIAVTRGALVHLSRDELQGVVAHEFSHILNGDMRLSTRLIGWLYGLTVVAMVARFVLRHAGRARGGGGRRGGGLPVILVAALIVLILGYVGLFFGRLIQATVSRRRESLADASAIQFTRNSDGLRGALVKIGALGAGSRFIDADAEEVAHLLFAAGMQRAFATHPPLVERIRAIDPRFDPREFGEMQKRFDAERARREDELRREMPAPADRLGQLLGGTLALQPEAVAMLVGNPGTEHVLGAQALLASLPAELRNLARDPQSAGALYMALALDGTEDARSRQLAFIYKQVGGDFHDRVRALLPLVDSLAAVQRMPALLQVFAGLKQLARVERIELVKCLNGLLSREGRVSVFAYALRKLSQVTMLDELEPRRRIAGRQSLTGAREPLQVLMSVLATHGSADEQEARAAYEAGMQDLLPGIHPKYSRPGHWTLELDQALTRLDALAPAAKGRLVQALVRTISHDRHMTVAESELLRAVCATLHCPLPPLYAESRPTGQAASMA